METQSFYTIALCVVAGGMTFIAGLMGYLYRQRDEQFEQAAKRVNELTTKLEHEELLTNRLSEELEQSKAIAMQHAADLNTLQAERATLYHRNEKGQIVPITPKPRKPHTLKYGMMVKDPTPKQAERIFREAKRAGILSAKAEMPSETFPYIFFSLKGVVTDCIAMECGNETYISATEFVKRIKGDVA